MILVKTVLERIKNGSISASSVSVGSGVFVYWNLLIVYLMQPLEVAMYGGRWFINYNIMLGHVAK